MFASAALFNQLYQMKYPRFVRSEDLYNNNAGSLATYKVIVYLPGDLSSSTIYEFMSKGGSIFNREKIQKNHELSEKPWLAKLGKCIEYPNVKAKNIVDIPEMRSKLTSII